MSREDPLKAEKDFTATLDEQFPQIDVLSKNDYKSALEKLLLLEKQTRQSSDLSSSKRVLVKIVDLLIKENDWDLLNEQILLLSKKHGQMKNSVQTLIKEVVQHIDTIEDEEVKIKTIENIRNITENKIFVEVERAIVSKILSDIYLSKKDLVKACDILCDLQVETYGSMKLEDKIKFILDQVHLTIMKYDFNKAKILSRKILVKNLNNYEDLKIEYYKLMIKINLNENDYLEIVKNYLSIFELASIKKNEVEYREILISVIYFIILSPFDNLQNDLINKIKVNPAFKKIEFQYELIKSFTTEEIMRWPIIEQIYKQELSKNEIFSPITDAGKSHYKDLKKRVIEHNLRVISKYYSNITIKRLNILLDLNESETEKNISNLVEKKIIYAKINKPAGIINFSKPKDSNDLLNDWSFNIKDLLNHIETIGHLITKEEMMNGIKSSA